MKKIILLVFITFYSNVYPQGGWYSQFNGSSADVLDLFFIDHNKGWAVGWSGTVLATINGGTNWISYNISGKYQLQTVSFANERIGCAGGFGYDGDFHPYLFRTTDGGVTWNISFQTFGAPGWLNSICFIDENLGFFGTTYFGSGHIYRTTNSGENWNLVNTNIGDGFYLNNIHFPDSDRGYITLYKIITQKIVNKIIKSTDAGNTWFELQRDTVPYSNTNFNRKITFFNDSIGYLQRGDLYKTTNGGLNFISKEAGFINSYYFPDKDTGWCTGYAGKIIKTVNGGNTWISQNISSGSDLFPVFFINSKTGWAAGGGLILKTYTGGINPVSLSNGDLVGYELFQNYPNPFNPVTNIKFTLRLPGKVTLTVYNVLGSRVADLIDDTRNAGKHEINFDAGKYNLPSGIYYYKLSSGSFEQTRKFILLK